MFDADSGKICRKTSVEWLLVQVLTKAVLANLPILLFIFPEIENLRNTTIAFRFIGRAFRFCVVEDRQNRLLSTGSIVCSGGSFCLPIFMTFLMMSYYLNSMSDIVTLIFTVLIALSIFFIIAKLLNSSAELIRVRRSERELSEYIDIQRRGYDRVVQKSELFGQLREHSNFYMPHRAYIANLDNSVGIVRYELLMLGNRRIPIPKGQFAAVQELVRDHFFKRK